VATGVKETVRRIRLDTFDRRLRAAGLTLEHEAASSAERLVLGRLDGPATVAMSVTDPRWPALADALPPGPIRDAILPVTGIRALMVVSDQRWRTQRLALRNKEGKTVARVELDEPTSAAARPAQLTVRALRGYDEQARRAGRLLVGLGLRAVDLEEDGEPSPAPGMPTADRTVPARVLLAAALSGFLATMRENVPGLIDDVDTEFLHDFRVAVRRTRATLKLGRPALPEVMRSRWEPAFKWLGDLTTPVRDLDVYELDLPVMSRWLVTADPADLDPLARHLRSRRMGERSALVRSLRSARFRRLVTEWDEELARLGGPNSDLPGGDVPGGDVPDDAQDDADRESLSAGQLADRSISRAYRRVARGGALIGAGSPAGDLHELRKKCKELRYALEVFAPLVDHAARKLAVADLKDLQDVLGRFQDCEVQRRALRGFAEEMMAAASATADPATAGAMLAMGELIGHLDVEQDRARQEFDVAFARFGRPSGLKLMYRLGGA
jgi:CHAD domain-containing protein